MSDRPINDVIEDMITQSNLGIPEVARRAKLSAQTIYYIIGNQPRKSAASARIKPKWDTVEAIANACGFTVGISGADGVGFTFTPAVVAA